MICTWKNPDTRALSPLYQPAFFQSVHIKYKPFIQGFSRIPKGFSNNPTQLQQVLLPVSQGPYQTSKGIQLHVTDPWPIENKLGGPVKKTSVPKMECHHAALLYRPYDLRYSHGPSLQIILLLLFSIHVCHLILIHAVSIVRTLTEIKPPRPAEPDFLRL